MRISLSNAATLFHADCRDAIQSLADNSLDSCVTDPPYALVSIVKRFGGANAAPAKGNDAYMRASAGFMGKSWDTGEVAMASEFWAEVYRVLKPGAFVAAFGASRGYHRMACAIEDAGFEIRDSLMWIYGTGFPKSHDVSKGIDREAGAQRVVTREGAVKRDGYGDDWDTGPSTDRPRKDLPATPEAAEWEGWGTALKPAFEPIVLARKPLSEGTVAANVLRWRTGALNIDQCRIHTEGSEARTYTSKRLQPGATVIKTGENMGRQEIAFEGQTKAGRWPANVVTDGSDEVVGMFPQSNGQLADARVDGAPKSGNVYGKMKHRNGEASAERRYTDEGGTNFAMKPGARRGDSGSAARFFYSAKASKADRNGSKHPTVKPISLMEWLATLITPPGGTILDPFAGSGTTGIAATNKGFQVILCERESEYVADIKNRFGTSRAAIPIPLDAYRRELELAPTLAALRSRLAQAV